MGRSSPEMTPSHFDIEKGCVEFEHGLSSFQEKLTSENRDLATRSTVLELEVEAGVFEKKMISENSNLDAMSSVQEESPTIFKVPRRLREVNVISIGPYHYRNPHLARMEDIKKRWFKKFVEKHHLGFDQFREAMKHLQRKTRKCYERPLPSDLKDDANFVAMMVYDGCFVLQLILEGHPDDFIELGRHVFYEIFYDLLLLENQLPFFVLLQLYSMIYPDPGCGHFYKLATSALKFFDKGFRSLPISPRHLLDLVRTNFELPSVNQADIVKIERNSMPSATELEDAGIHLLSVPIPEMPEQEKWKERMVGITFDNGTKELKIPILQVDDFTERLLRNYMAYEQFFRPEEQTYFVDYVVFIDDLINTSKDVELLRKRRIIDNFLGDDEAVTKMINKLCDSITYNDEIFYYKDIASQLYHHCNNDLNIWKAKLKKDYFNTPWSTISFLAALVLLLLTILQTIFSLLSYYRQRQ